MASTNSHQYQQNPHLLQKNIPPMSTQQPDLDDIDEAVPSNGCGCFRLCGLRFDREADYEQVQEEESWIVKKLKEVLEMVAGPKWKNFIIKKMGIKKQKNRFQYDPVSYALNFDEEDDGFSIGFSSRFAVPFPSRD